MITTFLDLDLELLITFVQTAPDGSFLSLVDRITLTLSVVLGKKVVSKQKETKAKWQKPVIQCGRCEKQLMKMTG